MTHSPVGMEGGVVSLEAGFKAAACIVQAAFDVV